MPKEMEVITTQGEMMDYLLKELELYKTKYHQSLDAISDLIAKYEACLDKYESLLKETGRI